MAFPLPHATFENCDGLLYCMAKWANTVTNDSFWTLILLGMCMVLIMGTANRFGYQRAFGFASVTGLLGSLFLVTMGLMTWWIASIFILAGSLGIVVMIISSEK